MRTARARISGEKRFDFLFMAPSSQSLEPPQYPGRFTLIVGHRQTLWGIYSVKHMRKAINRRRGTGCRHLGQYSEQGGSLNQGSVYRLYREANLAGRKRKRAKRPINERVTLQLAKAV
jgi:hypothetical protein